MTNRIAILTIIDQSEETSLYKAHSTQLSHNCSDSRTVNMSRCRFTLKNDRYIEATEWKGELCVDLREWRDDKPTKKGISLALMGWKNWVDYLEYAEQARTEKQNYKSHLRGNVY